MKTQLLHTFITTTLLTLFTNNQQLGIHIPKKMQFINIDQYKRCANFGICGCRALIVTDCNQFHMWVGVTGNSYIF